MTLRLDDALEFAQQNDLIKIVADCREPGEHTLSVPGAKRILEFLQTADRFMTETPPGEAELQEARDALLKVRRVFGQYYNELPLRDGLIHRCEDAIKGVPGDGDPSQAPFDVWEILGEVPESDR